MGDSGIDAPSQIPLETLLPSLPMRNLARSSNIQQDSMTSPDTKDAGNFISSSCLKYEKMNFIIYKIYLCWYFVLGFHIGQEKKYQFRSFATTRVEIIISNKVITIVSKSFVIIYKNIDHVIIYVHPCMYTYVCIHA